MPLGTLRAHARASSFPECLWARHTGQTLTCTPQATYAKQQNPAALPSQSLATTTITTSCSLAVDPRALQPCTVATMTACAEVLRAVVLPAPLSRQPIKAASPCRGSHACVNLPILLRHAGSLVSLSAAPELPSELACQDASTATHDAPPPPTTTTLPPALHPCQPPPPRPAPRPPQINAEKSPFLTDRLKIWMLPTLALIQNEKTVDYVAGFDQLGGKDDFDTSVLAERLAKSEMIDYDWSHGGKAAAAAPSAIRKGGAAGFKRTDSDEDSDFD